MDKLTWDSVVDEGKKEIPKNGSAVFGGGYEEPKLVSKGKGAVAEMGDTVDIAIESFCDGETYSVLTAPQRFYELGCGFLPDAFDEAIIGLKEGESTQVEIDLPFADDPWAEQNGTKRIDVSVTVNKILVDENR